MENISSFSMNRVTYVMWIAWCGIYIVNFLRFISKYLFFIPKNLIGIIKLILISLTLKSIQMSRIEDSMMYCRVLSKSSAVYHFLCLHYIQISLFLFNSFSFLLYLSMLKKKQKPSVRTWYRSPCGLVYDGRTDL